MSFFSIYMLARLVDHIISHHGMQNLWEVVVSNSKLDSDSDAGHPQWCGSHSRPAAWNWKWKWKWDIAKGKGRGGGSRKGKGRQEQEQDQLWGDEKLATFSLSFTRNAIAISTAISISNSFIPISTSIAYFSSISSHLNFSSQPLSFTSSSIN